MTDSASAPSHLTDSEMALYLDRRLSLEERDRIENHLGNCAECRTQVLAAQHVLGSGRRSRVATAGGVLAAAAVIFILITRAAPHDDQPTPQLRAIASDNAALVAYGPIGDAKRAGLRFVWGPAAGAVSYRLTLTTADGAQVWSRSGMDTLASLPSTVVLRAGEKYLWVADAILNDGSARSTGLREFSLVP